MDEMNKNSVYMESEDGEATTKGPKVVYAARVSPATKERLINVIERYTLETDKKTDKIENAIVRILDIVESDNVREMHPALDGSLRSVEGTIATLIKQINGIVVGLDETTTQLKNDRDQAIVDKQSALEDARIKILEAAEKKNEAEQMIQQAEKENAVVRIEAEREIQNARDQANDLIARNKETLDQAVRERNNAREIADEKNKSNDMLLKRMAEIEEKLAGYENLQKQNQELQKKCAEQEARMREDKVTAEYEKKQAVMEKERELQEKIQEAFIEKAKLQAKVELLSEKQEKE